MSSHPFMLIARQILRAVLFSGLLSLVVAPQIMSAQQSFTLTGPSSLNPNSVVPGEVATTNFTVTGSAGFTGSVALSCTVTSAATGVSPTCLISPDSVTPGAQPSLTVYTTAGTAGTPPAQYIVTITGTNSGSTPSTATLTYYLTVVNIAQDYTLSVSKPVSPGTVSPGNGATASILVTPVSGYNGTITLSCASITPAVVGAPTCSFDPAQITVTNGGAVAPSTLTISTFGTINNPVALRSTWRIFYALWLGVPGLALIGAGARASGERKLRPRFLGFLLLLTLASSILILPSCSSTTATSTSNLITPKNTYSFTLTGVDDNGISPSNVTTSPASVSLIVN